MAQTETSETLSLAASHPTNRWVRASYSVEIHSDRTRYNVTVDLDGKIYNLYFEVFGTILPPTVTRADFLALALLFFAMRHHANLYVDGPVSSQLLANLDEMQRAWVLWKPDLQVVEIGCQNEVDDRWSGDRRAVVAFSGGVDATFGLVRHALPRTVRGQCRVVAAMLVHGFDIPVDEAGAFGVARTNAHAMAEHLGVPLSIVKTNWRSIVGHWETEFGVGLAACLSLFSEVCDTGLLGSVEDYGHFVVPWGSNPVTNHLMSSESFRIVTEGGGSTRTQKVSEIASAGLADYLRVCWEGPRTGANCGVCEKCLRTKLNFMASGLSVPTSLGAQPTAFQVLGLKARNNVQLSYLADIAFHGRGALFKLVWICYWKNKVLNRTVRPFLKYAARVLRHLKHLIFR